MRNYISFRIITLYICLPARNVRERLLIRSAKLTIYEPTKDNLNRVTGVAVAKFVEHSIRVIPIAVYQAYLPWNIHKNLNIV